jgi:hypothetical protein
MPPQKKIQLKDKFSLLPFIFGKITIDRQMADIDK